MKRSGKDVCSEAVVGVKTINFLVGFIGKQIPIFWLEAESKFWQNHKFSSLAEGQVDLNLNFQHERDVEMEFREATNGGCHGMWIVGCRWWIYAGHTPDKDFKSMGDVP